MYTETQTDATVVQNTDIEQINEKVVDGQVEKTNFLDNHSNDNYSENSQYSENNQFNSYQLNLISDKLNDYNFGVDEKSDLQHLLAMCKKFIPNYDEKLIRLAFNYCIIAHEGKLRKSGLKFYTHPLSVACIVIQEIPLDNESVVAALLHNVLDESDIYTYEDIRFTFGTTIAQIVEGVSKIKFVESQHINRPDQMDNYRKLLLTLFYDIRIILIKLADKLHNMRTLQYSSIDKQRNIAQETLEIYVPFANRFGLRNIKFELEDLAFMYLMPSEYKHIEDTVKGTYNERKIYIERFKQPIVKLLSEEGLLKKEEVNYEISGRAKHIYSIYNKTILRQKKVEELYDIFAIRIVLDTDNPLLCFYTYGVVANYYKPIPETFKDYISNPKTNGYQSIHTAVAGPDGRIVEVQIRTKQMHIESEIGVAAHFRYKSSIQSSILEDHNIQSWLDEVRDIFENIGSENSSKLLGVISSNMLQDKIYVFTPNDEFRQLPKGATALDFAFDVHSRIGLNCIGVKINGKLSPISTILNSGDKVEVITSKTQEPSRDWFHFIVTPKANSELTKYFKRKDHKIIELGKQMWNEKNIENGFSFSAKELAVAVKSLNFETENEFFKAIGSKTLDIEKVYQLTMLRISDRLRYETDISLGLQETAVKIYKDIQEVSFNHNYKDMIDVKFEFLDCCNPLPGDSLFGMQESESIISVHNISCIKYKKLLQTHPNDLILLDWDQFQGKTFNATLKVIAEDYDNILQEIIKKITDGRNIQLTSLKFDVNNSIFEGIIGFTMEYDTYIAEIISDIESINKIQMVERVF